MGLAEKAQAGLGRVVSELLGVLPWLPAWSRAPYEHLSPCCVVGEDLGRQDVKMSTGLGPRGQDEHMQSGPGLPREASFIETGLRSWR